MCKKALKFGLITVGAGVVIGTALFGAEALSYARASVKQIQQTAKENVPIEFELARAKDLIDQIVPEMQANITLIAREEVEIEKLEREIKSSHLAVNDQRTRLARLRNMLDTHQAHFTINQVSYSRTQVRDDLTRCFDRVKEAELVLEGKQRLLNTRRHNLAAAIQALEKTRHNKAVLEDRVEALTGKYHLVKAANAEGHPAFDATKIAKADKLLKQIQTRLDVAERVLSHQAKFVEQIPLNDPINEAELISEIDEYLSPTDQQEHVPDRQPPGQRHPRGRHPPRRSHTQLTHAPFFASMRPCLALDSNRRPTRHVTKGHSGVESATQTSTQRTHGRPPRRSLPTRPGTGRP